MSNKDDVIASSSPRSSPPGTAKRRGGEAPPPRKDSRFQVFRTDETEELPLLQSDQEMSPRTRSEPPLPPPFGISAVGGGETLLGRKTSQSQSSGRFVISDTPEGTRAATPCDLPDTVVNCLNGGNGVAGDDSSEGADQGEEEEDEDCHPAAPLMAAGGKSVQFSVGDRPQQPSEEMRRSVDTEGNATINLKSWRNMKTLEHPPIIDFYRQSLDMDGVPNSRPSMSQLIHGQGSIPEEIEIEDFKVHSDDLLEGQSASAAAAAGDGHDANTDHSRLEKFAPPPNAARVKFGWVQGVFVRCLLNIFGVMLYLRISWVAGQAGVVLGSGIVLLASVVTTITALSTCAICTNGDVKGGGAYFLISRSLGPEFGGSIGLIFSVANAVGAAMYIVGFAETVRDLLREAGVQIIDGDLNDVRIVGLVTCCVLMGVVFIGTAFESRMQIGLLAILTLSLINYFIGSFMAPGEAELAKGGTGYSWNTLRENLLPAWRGEDFFSVFSVYFPAATGIMAGANISGDLADPQRAIPKGTLLAIAVTTCVYLATVWMTGATCVRDADGIFPPIFTAVGDYVAPECAANGTCSYGLMNYFQVMEMESAWGPLITAGIFAATLSSALASLVSAPKVFQAVCKDRLFPKIDIFAKGFGKNEEPRRAYGLAFVIAIVMILIGDLNAIAPIISNFFLASYALINYACFDQSFADSPGFRPGFKYYNMWVSLAGALLCIVVMFIISWATALITFFFFAMLFLYILHRKPDVNWGSSTQAHSYKNAIASMFKLWNTEEHVKNYRPQLLVLCGNPAARPSLVDFVYNITKGSSLMICGYVVPYSPSDRVYAVCRKLDRQLNDWLKKRKVKSFYSSVANPSLRAGAQALLQSTGLGRLKPNIVILGFKANWCEGSGGPAGPSKEKLAEINDYFGVIQDSFENGMGVGVLRNSAGGLDFSEAMKRFNLRDSARLQLPIVPRNLDGSDSRRPSDYPLADNKKSSDAELKLNGGGGIDGGGGGGGGGESRPEGESAEKKNKEEGDGEEETDRPSAASSFADNFPFDFDLESEEADEEEDDEDEGEDEEEEEEMEEEEEKDATEKGGGGEKEGKEGLGGERTTKVVIDVEKGEGEGQGGFARGAGGNGQHSMRRMSLRRRSSRRPTHEERALLNSISRFQKKIKKGVIDVWWLYDDGGLSLLIPHLLTIPKSYLEGAKLRVFTISTSSRTMEQEQRGMAALLSKFRIDFSDVFVLADVGKKPKQRTTDAFHELIAPFRAPENGGGSDDGNEGDDGRITESELSSQKEKTNRQLRIGELLQEHSYGADLVVVTLPVPRKGLVSSCLYLAWLDMMTRGLPPTLLIRGNQTSVLTFYS